MDQLPLLETRQSFQDPIYLQPRNELTFDYNVGSKE